MKTIAVSERAYERLTAWKRRRGDSFSKVIERLVPPKGTFAAAVEAAKQLPALSPGEDKALQEFYEKTRRPVKEPWK